MGDDWKQYLDEDLKENQRFFVSRIGFVKSFHKGTEEPKLLKGTINNGYKVIWVRLKNDKRTARYVHKMMAETFIPNPENKEFVIHLNHKKLDNFIGNLKWATFDEWKEHNKEQFKTMKGKLRSERNPHSKLTETQVIRLKKKLLDPNRKTRISILAKQFNVSEGQLYRIKREENWAHIKV